MARQPSNPGPRGRSGTIQLRIASKTEILAPRESPGYRDPWCRANEMAPTMIRTTRGASSLLGRWLGSLALAGEILAKGRAPFRSTGEALRYRRHTSDTVGNRDGRREQKPSRQLRLYPVPNLCPRSDRPHAGRKWSPFGEQKVLSRGRQAAPLASSLEISRCAEGTDRLEHTRRYGLTT